MPTVVRRLAVAVLGLAIVAVGCSPTPTTPSEVAAPPPGTDLTIRAENVTFVPATLSARAGVPLRVTLQNADDDIPHNLRLLAPPAFQRSLLETEVILGPAEVTMAIPGLAPGRYRFDCSVHPSMVSDLGVG
jgi:plastocyanin